ncbi:NYN domain-containing protein [Pseudofrankia sp. DC12]|uniref:NYN domain-containing protein n=1 Tax=Pseudofrankia sp. DC12 TaxID=683315 RepID=UPI0005F7BCB3|nr:NYN domain-containing protein [Pseudofrankia sp. DC12]
MVVEVPSARLAVLVDAENAPLAAVGPLLAEIARFGRAQVKRAYGDWTAASLKSWKKTLLDLSIRPVQVFAAVRGKNAADMALVIEAMDLLHSGAFDGFCLVSSDSDFTRLAERIREAGLTVYGFGEERKTNPGLVAACDTFVFVETLAAAPAPPVSVWPALAAEQAQALGPADTSPPPVAPGTTSVAEASVPGLNVEIAPTAAASPEKRRKKKTKAVAAAPPTRSTTAELQADAALVSRLRDAVATNHASDGWTSLSAIGQAIRKRPAVILKPYGYSRLKDLIAATDLFDIQQRGRGGSGAVYVRVK